MGTFFLFLFWSSNENEDAFLPCTYNEKHFAIEAKGQIISEQKCGVLNFIILNGI